MSFTDECNNQKTDKGITFGEAHGYSIVYDMLLKSKRQQVANVLEIGLKIHTHTEKTKLSERRIDSCPSISCLLNYFPNATVHGVDLSKNVCFENERFKFYSADQGNLDDLAELSRQLTELDLIIDDGSHASYDQLLSFVHLFETLVDDGFYIIEDLYWQPPESKVRLSMSTFEVFHKLAIGEDINTGSVLIDNKIKALLPDISAIISLNTGLVGNDTPTLLIIEKKTQANLYTDKELMALNSIKALRRNGSFQEVITQAKNQLDYKNRFTAEIYLILIKSYAEANDYNLALECIDRLYALEDLIFSDDLLTELDVLKADILYAVGDMESSAKLLEKILTISPENDRLRIKLLNANIKQGSINSLNELEDFTHSITDEFSKEEVFTIAVEFLYSKGLYADALELLNKPEYSWHLSNGCLLMLKGLIYLSKKDYVKAEQSFSLGAKCSSFINENYINLGRVFFIRKKYSDLLKLFNLYQNDFELGPEMKELGAIALHSNHSEVDINLIDSIADYSHIYFKKEFFGLLLDSYRHNGRVEEAADILKTFYF